MSCRRVAKKEGPTLKGCRNRATGEFANPWASCVRWREPLTRGGGRFHSVVKGLQHVMSCANKFLASMTVTLFEGSLYLLSCGPRVRGLTRGFMPPSLPGFTLFDGSGRPRVAESPVATGRHPLRGFSGGWLAPVIGLRTQRRRCSDIPIVILKAIQ